MRELQTEILVTRSIKRRPIPSATIELAQKARLLKAAGKDIIELAGGDPDFTPDLNVQKGIIRALVRGETGYTHPRGIPELRKAIAAKLKRENGIPADPDNEIIVTVGGKQAIAVTLIALLENGDEVLIPDPSWVSYTNMTIIAGGNPIHLSGNPLDGFRISPHDLDKFYTGRTKALILNNPHNPTGQVYSRERIRDIAEWCLNRGVYLISDEVYEHIIFDNKSMYSPASDDRFSKFVITVNAVSKTYAMTGLRLGWLHAPEWLVNKIDPVHQHLITCASSVVQWGAKVALEGSKHGVLIRRNSYESRRNLVVELLSRSNKIEPLIPEATFYIFLNIKKSGLNSNEFCSILLEEGGLALCPGSAFGTAGEGWVRMLFARDEDTLRDACNRLNNVYG